MPSSLLMTTQASTLKIQTTKPEQAVQHGRTRTAVSRRFGRACRRDQRRRRCAQVRLAESGLTRDLVTERRAAPQAVRHPWRGVAVAGQDLLGAGSCDGPEWRRLGPGWAGWTGTGGPAPDRSVPRGSDASVVRRETSQGVCRRLGCPAAGRWSGGRCGRPGRGVGATRSSLGVAIGQPRCCRWRPWPSARATTAAAAPAVVRPRPCRGVLRPWRRCLTRWRRSPNRRGTPWSGRRAPAPRSTRLRA